MDVFVAAYFAASGDPESDGAVWWFDQSAFEAALNANDKKQWKDWNVPLRRDGSGQRALEKRAFDNGATPWISKLHHYLPFNRMKVQRGFFTASGRLDTPQDEAIDKLGEHVPRGRIVVSKELKRPLLDHLERMGIHAQAIDFPGADAVGCDLARHCRVKNGSRLRQTGRRRRSGI